MNPKQTVKIFLAEGNPTGLRVLELFNWNGRGVIIPRDRIEASLSREDLITQGVYLLIGESEDGDGMIYIGESENLKDRVRSHNKTKDFWDTAICFFSKDGNLNKAHVKYLEELLIAESVEAGRMKIENGNQPSRTRLSESDEAEVLIFAENIKLILSTVGYTFLKKPTEYESEDKEVFLCKGPDAEAKGFYSSEGLVVLQGSVARKEIAESAKDRHLKMRPTLLADGSLKDNDEKSYIFTKDVVFSSPSNAAQNVLARNANGWIEWKRESDGKTLDEVYRQS
jgi:predicted type IV restriction endonuclease